MHTHIIQRTLQLLFTASNRQTLGNLHTKADLNKQGISWQSKSQKIYCAQVSA
jgi:hypothetical protein